MKTTLIILFAALWLVSCDNSSSSKQVTDSTTINTESGNVSDGGPNNGMGDTNSYNRMNDKIIDTVPQK